MGNGAHSKLVPGSSEVDAIANDVGERSLAGDRNSHEDHRAVRVACGTVGGDGRGAGVGTDYFSEGVPDAADVDLTVGVNEGFAILSRGGMRKAHEVVLGVRRSIGPPACVQKSVGGVRGTEPLLNARELHERPLITRAYSVDDNASREHRNCDRKSINRGADAFKSSRDSLQRDGDEHGVAEVLSAEDLNEGTGASCGKMNGK